MLYPLLVLLLLAIIVIDLRLGIIPDTLNIAVAVLGAVVLWRNPQIVWWTHVAGALAMAALGAFFAGPYSKWRKRDMLGWGDVKFLAAAGLWLFPTNIGWFLAGAGLLGVLFSIIYKYSTKTPGWQGEAPFAPALCISLGLIVAVQNGMMAQLLY